MKGSRAKKEAEAAAAADGGAALEPTPPAGKPEGGPRPGPLVKASGERVQIPAVEFAKLIGSLRKSELLGAAAADAFEAAAGMRAVATPQSKGAKDLRSEVSDSRENSPEKPKKKGGMKFDDAPVDEIPDLPEEPEDAGAADEEVVEDGGAEKEEPPELNLTPKQNHMRTDLEMWVMDDIPPLFGVDDSEELPEPLQEDGQADRITFLIAETDEEAQAGQLEKWLSLAECPDADARGEFTTKMLEQVRAIQALGPKKKKKKKKADA